MRKTVAECNQIAEQLCSGPYRYLYGAKGQLYTKQLVETLAKQHKSKYTAALKAEAMKDADKGFRAGDCSFFVCSVLGLEMINSIGIRNKAVKLLKINKKNAKEGMALWKQGHIAYIGPELKVYEFMSTARDAQIHSFDSRAKDFTYMFIVKGSALDQETQTAASTISMYYPAYKGGSTSIVSALAAVGEKDTSFAHRKRIASANKSESILMHYEGSIKQNLKMVELLKAGKLIKA